MGPAAGDREVQRLGFFGDAVFAVVLTLLVTHIIVPENYIPSGAVHDALGDAVPQLLGVAVAFLALGVVWADHHRLFTALPRYDTAFFWGNLALLGSVVLLSFPAATFTKHLDAPVALLFFGGSISAVALVLAALTRYASARLSDGTATRARVVLAIPLLFALSMPFIPVNLTIRDDSFSLAIVFWIVALPAARLAFARVGRSSAEHS